MKKKALFVLVILAVLIIFCVTCFISEDSGEKINVTEQSTSDEVEIPSDEGASSEIETMTQEAEKESIMEETSKETETLKETETSKESEAESEFEEETKPVEEVSETEVLKESAVQEPEKTESKPQETVHTHSYTVSSETAATCMAEGAKVFQCSCGDSYTEKTAKIDHNYVTDNKAAACASDGYKKTYCSVCGLVDSETVVKATGQHSYSSTVTTAAGCGTDGVMTYSCSGCGNSYTESIPATASHAFFETSRQDALCHEDGWITYHCAYCEISKTEAIPALGGEHNFVEQWFLQPSCAGNGEGHGQKCSRCGYYEELPELTEGLGCVADEGTVYRAGTCTRPAKLKHYCVRCGGAMPDSEGSIDPNNHDWVVHDEWGEFCADCGISR